MVSLSGSSGAVPHPSTGGVTAGQQQRVTDRWMLTLQAVLVWILVVLVALLSGSWAHSAGIPFAMERAARGPGSAIAVTVQSSQWHLALPQLILAQSHHAVTCHIRDTSEPRELGLGWGGVPRATTEASWAG